MDCCMIKTRMPFNACQQITNCTLTIISCVTLSGLRLGRCICSMGTA